MSLRKTLSLVGTQSQKIVRKDYKEQIFWAPNSKFYEKSLKK